MTTDATTTRGRGVRALMLIGMLANNPGWLRESAAQPPPARKPPLPNTRAERRRRRAR